MKRKTLIKKIEKFKLKHEGTCYCLVGGHDFYNSVFVLPLLKNKEDIVIHDGRNSGISIYEIISTKEFIKRVSLLIDYPCGNKEIVHRKIENKVYENISLFEEENGNISDIHNWLKD